MGKHEHHFSLNCGHLLGMKLREFSQRHPVLAVSVLVLLSISLSLLVSKASIRQICSSTSTSEIEEKAAFRSTTVGFFFRTPVPACNSSSSQGGGKKIKVVFASCVNMHLGSMLMRGIVIARLLQAPLFPDFSPVVTKDCIKDFAKLKGPVDYCIFIKFSPEPQAIAKCQSLGAKLILDLVDAKEWQKSALYQSMDYVIASTSYQRRDILMTLNWDPERVWIIPHHHDNNPSAIDPSKAAKPVQVIGWQGAPESRPHEAEMKKLLEFCVKHGIEFKELTYRPPGKSFAAMENYTQHFQKNLSSLDIALILPPLYPQKSIHKELFYVKPATRALLTMSLGIPTIMFPYISYLELAQIYKNPLYATAINEFTMLLEYLVTDPHARQYHAEQGLSTAAMFTQESIVGLYAYHMRAALGSSCHAIT